MKHLKVTALSLLSTLLPIAAVVLLVARPTAFAQEYGIESEYGEPIPDRTDRSILDRGSDDAWSGPGAERRADDLETEDSFYDSAPSDDLYGRDYEEGLDAAPEYDEWRERDQQRRNSVL